MFLFCFVSLFFVLFCFVLFRFVLFCFVLHQKCLYQVAAKAAHSLTKARAFVSTVHAKRSKNITSAVVLSRVVKVTNYAKLNSFELKVFLREGTEAK